MQVSQQPIAKRTHYYIELLSEKAQNTDNTHLILSLSLCYSVIAGSRNQTQSRRHDFITGVTEVFSGLRGKRSVLVGGLETFVPS